MTSPSEKLAESLAELRVLQQEGRIAIQSSELKRHHRERLLKEGFIQRVMKGWYIPGRPDETAGESSTWYAAYWKFCVAYLNKQKESDWCVAPEQSILLHAENWTVPQQLLIRSSKARNQKTDLPYGTSLFETRAALPVEADLIVKAGVRLFSLPAALMTCPAAAFTKHPTDMRTALAMIQDATEILEKLLEGGHSTVAGRLAGAFRNTGQESIADDIVKTMKAAGYAVRENDPFATHSSYAFSGRERSPYVNRLNLMWQAMREPVIKHFPEAPGLPGGAKKYLKEVADIYTTDAYHSLSIEGYRVTPELIERVRVGDWQPDLYDEDRKQADALAARGYWQAFQKVEESIEKILEGASPGLTASADHRDWYRAMFAPAVTAGLLKATDLAGYRNGPVHIRRSMHVPPGREAVRDAIPALFKLLADEEHPAVRAVLGHFVFVYIHPYMDGNGRMGRFLMNTMMAGGGYPWLVIPVEDRAAYMTVLEAASVEGNIVPFTRFLSKLVTRRLTSLG